MNIKSNFSKHPCTSCQVCAAICPHQAIEIKLDKYGFYRPFIKTDACTDCSLCTKVCYKFNDVTSLNRNISVWSAIAKDYSILKETTSGGIADILAKKLIELGYICCGVSYNYDKDIAESTLAHNKQETNSFRGSKYIQSFTFPAFKEILTQHKTDKIAVFGLPCHIYAINQYLTLRQRKENFILIDFYCHGCPSIHLWKKYLKDCCSILPPYSHIEFRSKKQGWGNYCVQITSKNGNQYTSPKGYDPFYTLFFSDHLLNKSCHTCQLRGSLDYADIRLGDFWGKKYIFNKRGVSILTILSPKGENLFNSIKNDIHYQKHELNEIAPYQSLYKIYHPNIKLRNLLLEQLSIPKTKLQEILNLYILNLSKRERIKYHLKNNILKLPHFLISIIKRII